VAWPANMLSNEPLCHPDTYAQWKIVLACIDIAVVHNSVRNVLASLAVAPAKAGVQSRVPRD
jgi:hypothetical protein